MKELARPFLAASLFFSAHAVACAPDKTPSTPLTSPTSTAEIVPNPKVKMTAQEGYVKTNNKEINRVYDGRATPTEKGGALALLVFDNKAESIQFLVRFTRVDIPEKNRSEKDDRVESFNIDKGPDKNQALILSLLTCDEKAMYQLQYSLDGGRNYRGIPFFNSTTQENQKTFGMQPNCRISLIVTITSQD